MDVFTHLLASLALARGLFPRQPWRFLFAVVVAGVLADVDLLTLLLGPSGFLSGRYTWTHSLLGTAAVIVVAALLGRLLMHKPGPARNSIRDPQKEPQKAGPKSSRFAAILIATSLAAVAHLLMDLATSQGVAVLWPFRQTRFAWDLLPGTDPWILAVLLAGLLLPELFALISSEIGAKDRAPRGRNGALTALALILIYTGGRFLLHASAAAQLDAHSYRGESPRRVAALPDPLSLFVWHGIAETTSQVCMAEISAVYTKRFDSETASCAPKPEPSAALTTAQQTDSAQRFVAVARFPKASVGAPDSETEVVIRDVRDFAEGEARFALAARILTDASGRVASQRIVWARNVRSR